VDSSVAALLLREAGHDVTGVTLKLWGGASDSGCCSVADVEDARFVARQLQIRHLVLNLTEIFEERVVAPFVAGSLAGWTPNPCMACNREVKFGLLLERARALGFAYVATGHHARLVEHGSRKLIARGADPAKDQSYVLASVAPSALERLLLPIGEFEKRKVRAIAESAGLRTARKPDSLELCFVRQDEGRERFLASRGPLHRARVSDAVSGRSWEEEVAFETLTVGQRRGIGGAGDGLRRYVLAKDPATRTVTVGTANQLLVRELPVEDAIDYAGAGWPIQGCVQGSAHGRTIPGTLDSDRLVFDPPARRVAPGQRVVVYHEDRVVASATVRDA
jgi:tRNA-specific 2-thiouridylase